jgi:3-hydroxyisobutyrate dehydrogenase-like beta-hydroxyacid dehydrogenase
MVIGVVSPGAMGSAVGASLARSGHRVVATLAGRSARTRDLAAAAPFDVVDDLAAVTAGSDLVLSVVPPGQAAAVAEAVAGVPLLVDLNAISPLTVDQIDRALAGSGTGLVDGSISGPPPWQPGTTRIYLSGPRAAEVAALGFDGVDVRVVGAELGAASAVKMCTGSVYKGTALILAHALVAARRNGVLDEVRDDLEGSFPELMDGIDRYLASSASKAHRYVGEMDQIAATQGAAGLPPEVFEAMATAYEHLARSPAGDLSPEQAASAASLADVLAGMEPESGLSARSRSGGGASPAPRPA